MPKHGICFLLGQLTVLFIEVRYPDSLPLHDGPGGTTFVFQESTGMQGYFLSPEGHCAL